MGIGAEMFTREMGERVVFAYTGTTVYNVNVFHSTAYVRREWGRFFEVLDIKREHSSYQDVVVLRKV